MSLNTKQQKLLATAFRRLKNEEKAKGCGFAIETMGDDITIWSLTLKYANDIKVKCRVSFLNAFKEGGGIPEIYILTPRMTAGFIHNGAVCLSEMGLGEFVINVDGICNLIFVLLAKLDPCAPPESGADVPKVVDGGGTYTDAEHQSGRDTISCAHPDWGKQSATTANKLLRCLLLTT